jgi:hypothetical protein
MNLFVKQRTLARLIALAACGAATAACGDPEHAPPLNLDALPSGRPDSGAYTQPVTKDAGPALLDLDTWAGERRTFKIWLGRMLSPGFSAWPEDLVALTKPATVHYPFNKYDYVHTYDPTVINMFTNVPVGSSFVMVSDVDGGNGILNSLFPAAVGTQALSPSLSWDVPVTTVKSLDDIYASLGYVIDPNFAQVIVSVSTALISGDQPVANAVVSTTGASAQTILYDTIGGQFTDATTKTGPLGMAIIVNMNAAGLDYPGKWFPLYVTVNGVRQSTVPQFPAVKNAVSRVYFMQGGIEGG